MKTPAQLTRILLSSAVIASGLTVVAAIAAPLPASAAVTTPTKVISVQRNAALGAFLTQGGDIYTFGDNSAGATGLGLTTGVTETPAKLTAFAPAGEKVVQIAISGTGSLSTASGVGLALTDGGHVYSWGYDGQGGLGNDATLTNQSTPVAVSATWGSDKPVYIASVAGGGRVVTESGHVYAWGYNEWGQTGVANGGGDIATPVEVTSLYRPTDKVVQIVGGSASMIVRTASGTVLAAGSKARGQRGDGTSDPDNYNTYTPALSQPSFTGLPAGDSIVSIGSGTSYSFAVSGTGKIWGWGFGQSGRLGDGGGTHDQLTPLAISPTLVDSGDKVASVEIGGSGNTSMLLTTQGHLYTVGSGNNGMLGNGATTNTTAFGKITSWPGRGSNDPIIDGVVGSSNALAVTQSGVVYTWGNSLITNQGGIGTGTQNQTGTPPNIVSSPVLLAQPVVLSSFTDAVDASVTGTVKVGTALTASGGTYAPSDASLAYAWKIGSDSVSTTSSYTPKLADAGKSLTLTVTGSKSGYTDSVSTTTGQTVATIQGFTGTVKAGQTLTASDTTGTSTWGLSASSSCTSPTTATGTTYALPSDSAGKYVQLSQTLSGRTGAGTCVGPIAAATSAPTITGAGTAAGVKGESFSYTPTSVDGQPAPTVTVVGTLPTGVTVNSSTGKLSGTPSAAGSFAVTLRADNGVGTAATLSVTITIDDVVSGLSPTISGSPKVGVQLTASPGGSLSPDAGNGAAVAYLWQYESAPGTWTDLTAGATYTPGTSEVGRSYRVKVTVSKTGFQSRTEYSSATAEAVKGTFSIGAPTVSGAAEVGETLTCAAAAGTLGTVSYAWKRGATAVGSAATYELLSNDRDNKLTCTVTSVRTGYENATNSTDSATVDFGTFSIAPPSISGSAKVGETLTCAPAAGTPGTVSYLWKRNATLVGSAASRELVPGDRDNRLTCTVSAERAGYRIAMSTTESETVDFGTFTIAAPSISGSAKVGETLTCAPAAGTLGTISYAWARGATPLETGATYQLTADDRTEKVTCTVTAMRAGYTDATSSKDSATVETGSFSIDEPSISGTAKVGQTLTCAAAPGTLGTVSYAWTRGATPVDTGATYQLTAADRTTEVTCTVTSGRAGYTDATSSKDSATVETGSFSIDEPSITGTAKVGQTLTCAAAPGTLGTVSYAWTRGATPLDTGATYQLTVADRTNEVTCTATSERAGYTDATNSAESETVEYGIFSIDEPSISGTAKVGQTLTCAAAPGTLGTVSYAWTRGATPLDTGATYELTVADRTNEVTCTATSERSGYTDATNSADSETVGYGVFSIDDPSIAGTAKVGQTLTCAAAPGTLGTVSYAWTRGATPLGSDATYELTPDDRTEQVTCTVTSVRAGYTDATSSEDSATVGSGTFSIGALSLTGDANVGKTLSCAVPAPMPGTVSYVWTRGATALSTGATYELTPADLGQVVTCTATVVREGYQDATATAASASVKPGAASSYRAAVKGNPKVGLVVHGAVKDLPAAASVTWQWYRGQTPIAGATDASYVLPGRTFRERVRVVATIRVPGYEDATASAQSRKVGVRRLTLAVSKPTAYVGGKVRITIDHLLPGERWTVSFGNDQRIVSGRASAAGGRLVRTVRLPAKISYVKSKRHVKVETTKPNRVAWTPVTLKRR